MGLDYFIHRKVMHLIDDLPAKREDWSYRDISQTLVKAIEFGRELERKTYVRGHFKRDSSCVFGGLMNGVHVRSHLRGKRRTKQ
jgi:hypothetical protein